MYQFTALCQLRMNSSLQRQTCAQTGLPTRTTEEEDSRYIDVSEEAQTKHFLYVLKSRLDLIWS